MDKSVSVSAESNHVMFNSSFLRAAYRLRPLTACLGALYKGVTAAVEGVAEFFRVLPSALASGMADTMAAHGRDPHAGLAISFTFDAVDRDDWAEVMRQQREVDSYHLALNGIYPTEPEHLGLYHLVKERQHGLYR